MPTWLRIPDTALGIVQRVLVIAGILFSAWFFLLREDNAPRVQMAANPTVRSDCTLGVALTVENVGRVGWGILWAHVNATTPDLRASSGDTANEVSNLASQTRRLDHRLRSGESTQIVFNLPLDVPDGTSSLDLAIALQLDVETGESSWLDGIRGWMSGQERDASGTFRLVQHSVDLADCA